MKKYGIEVDCANCALKMEEAANKVPGVAKATVSFMTQKMNVEFEEGVDPKVVMEEVKKIFKPEFINRIDDIMVFHPLNT